MSGATQFQRKPRGVGACPLPCFDHVLEEAVVAVREAPFSAAGYPYVSKPVCGAFLVFANRREPSQDQVDALLDEVLEHDPLGTLVVWSLGGRALLLRSSEAIQQKFLFALSRLQGSDWVLRSVEHSLRRKISSKSEVIATRTFSLVWQDELGRFVGFIRARGLEDPSGVFDSIPGKIIAALDELLRRF